MVLPFALFESILNFNKLIIVPILIVFDYISRFFLVSMSKKLSQLLLILLWFVPGETPAAMQHGNNSATKNNIYYLKLLVTALSLRIIIQHISLEFG